MIVDSEMVGTTPAFDFNYKGKKQTATAIWKLVKLHYISCDLKC